METNRPENIRGKSFAAMSTASLQELLQAELDSDRDVDLEKLKEILAVLDERTEQKEVDVDAAWDRFIHNHLPAEPLYPLTEDTPTKKKKSSRKKHPVRIGVLAALIAIFMFCLGAGVAASAADFDVWNAVMQWSSETFGFSFCQDIDASSHVSDPEYTDLKCALANAGLTEPLIPYYLPDGYKQVEFNAQDGRFAAMYKKADSVIGIKIQEIGDNNSTLLEKDQIEPEVYTVGGVNHYVSTNDDEYLAVWANDGYECFISGVQTKEELFKMIDSIYTEESK